MNRNDVLREVVAAVRRAGCKMTDAEAAARVEAAASIKPRVSVSPAVCAKVVKALRDIGA
jgi:glycine cleavage system regulatory protein